MNIPYIITSPGPMEDVDEPANHVPAPLAGFPLLSEAVADRCLNLIYRIKFRLATCILLILGTSHRSTGASAQLHHEQRAPQTAARTVVATKSRAGMVMMLVKEKEKDEQSHRTCRCLTWVCAMMSRCWSTLSLASTTLVH